MTKRARIFVDFNEPHEDGVMTSLRKFADNPLKAGEVVVATDNEGMNCLATVSSLFDNGIVILKLDMSPNYFQD